MKYFLIAITFIIIPLLSIIFLYKKDGKHRIWLSVPIILSADVIYCGDLLNYSEYGGYIIFSMVLIIIPHILCVIAAILLINYIKSRNKPNDGKIKRLKLSKKSAALVFIIAIIILGFIPERNTYDDGGTVEYSAFLYKVIVWNKMYTDDIDDREIKYRTGTDVYIFPFNFGEKT